MGYKEDTSHYRYYTSPKTSQRGCLCKDKLTYSRKCCDGSYQAQGIGKI